MHEMGIAMEVLRIAVEAAGPAVGPGDGPRIRTLKLRVGRWSGVEPESLRFSLEVVSEGTRFEGGQLEIELVEPEFSCGSCARSYRAEGYLDPCPFCGGSAEALVAGDELVLSEIEVEE